MKKILFFLLFIFTSAFFFFGGVYYDKTYLNKTAQKIDKNSEKMIFQAGWDAAKDRVYAYGLCGILEDNQPRMALSGKIEKKDGNNIKLKIIPLEPFADPDLDYRIISIGENTKIYKMVEKSKEEYDRELDAFLLSQEEYTTEEKNYLLPPKTKKIEVEIDNLKLGDNIFVISEKNIKNEKAFTAKEITIN